MNAPVALFLYKRLKHLKVTIDALLKNELASNTELFLFSDGYRDDSDKHDVCTVRDYIKTISGFKKIHIIEQQKNKGLADSIVEGVTELVNRFGNVIVLEDDIITSPFFLRYMNDSLDLYCDTEQVMHIAAYTPPIKQSGLSDYFFFRQSSCWGWATWKRSWDFFNRDHDFYIEKFTRQDIKRLNFDGKFDMWEQLLANKHGKMKTWAIYWYCAVFYNTGLCLHPRFTLSYNIGFDGSGEHCSNSGLRVKRLFNTEYKKPLPDLNIVEDGIGAKRIMNYYKKTILKKILHHCKSQFYKIAQYK